jgi:hypothetical protein
MYREVDVRTKGGNGTGANLRSTRSTGTGLACSKPPSTYLAVISVCFGSTHDTFTTLDLANDSLTEPPDL